MAESMKIEGHLVNTSVSIGIAIYPENGEKIKPLLKKADEAMYLAKEHGRNRVEIYKG
ncbi:diguanylate cyclase [bacterium]|nr:diguanylate cyclase [bacterium]